MTKITKVTKSKPTKRSNKKESPAVTANAMIQPLMVFREALLVESKAETKRQVDTFLRIFDTTATAFNRDIERLKTKTNISLTISIGVFAGIISGLILSAL